MDDREKKSILGYYVSENELMQEVNKISGFGNPSQFIKSVTLPKTMYKGDEYIPSESPVIIIQRTESSFKEFFTKPLFTVAKKIKIQFHWNGIEVVGSYMDKPNSFVLPIPSKVDEYPWYLKIICNAQAINGFKPFYISIDTYHEIF